jgi:hypothetical protein
VNDLRDAFTQLIGKQPSDAEVQQLYKVRDALGIKNNDALWLVLIALQYYEKQYEKFPRVIAKAAQDTLSNFKETADSVIEASAQAAKEDLAKAVAQAAQEVARNTAAKQMWQWALGCIAAAFLCFGAFGWYMHSSAYKAGFSAGYAEGYKKSVDEKAAASWANTPQGRLAYRFAQLGQLDALARCEGDGWRVENGACYPFPTKDGRTYGWRMP